MLLRELTNIREPGRRALQNLVQQYELLVDRLTRTSDDSVRCVISCCMDERMCPCKAFGVVPGQTRVFSAAGGVKDEVAFLEYLVPQVKQARESSLSILLLLGLHSSSSTNHHLGCAAFGYDTNAARAANFNMRDRVKGEFGDFVFPVVFEYDTETGAITFYNKIDIAFSIGEFFRLNKDKEDCISRLHSSLENHFEGEGIPQHVFDHLFDRACANIAFITKKGLEVKEFDHAGDAVWITPSEISVLEPKYNKAFTLSKESISTSTPVAAKVLTMTKDRGCITDAAIIVIGNGLFVDGRSEIVEEETRRLAYQAKEVFEASEWGGNFAPTLQVIPVVVYKDGLWPMDLISANSLAKK